MFFPEMIVLRFPLYFFLSISEDLTYHGMLVRIDTYQNQVILNVSLPQKGEQNNCDNQSIIMRINERSGASSIWLFMHYHDEQLRPIKATKLARWDEKQSHQIMLLLVMIIVDSVHEGRIY